MNVLLLGAGGREHALAFALSKSPKLNRLFIAPGNPGTAQFGTNIVLDVKNHQAVIDFCKLMQIVFVVVGPEAPLVAGLVDDLEAANIKAFGPKRAAAQLEGSKDYVKQLCRDFHIPTADYKSFHNQDKALSYIELQGAPIVIKYDGLMAGKGVTVATTIEEANTAIAAIYSSEPEALVVIEECLLGEEISFFCLCDGITALPLGSAQDHKRAYDGDKGPNTGGMGAYSPAPAFTPELQQRTMAEIIVPTLEAMSARGAPYSGVLFAGLMLTSDGPKLIEYNVRFGDPECQVLMLRLDSDLLDLLLACSNHELATKNVHLKQNHAITIVMASEGYPNAYLNNTVIKGVNALAGFEGVQVFHAGTQHVGDKLLANGGRVLNICGFAPSIQEARALAYSAIAQIDWPQGFYRKDIAWRVVGN